MSASVALCLCRFQVCLTCASGSVFCIFGFHEGLCLLLVSLVVKTATTQLDDVALAECAN